MSHRALGPQFIHASPHDLEPGAVLGVRDSNFSEGGKSEGVYMSSSRGEAEDWAHVIGAGRHDKVHLYEVEPHGSPVEQDSGFYGLREHVARSATVKRYIDSVRTGS